MSATPAIPPAPGTIYYFAKNLQGDVIALYLWNGTSTGTLVATYKYDLWGKPIGIYNASGATISQTAANVAAYNPFRYRGYYYDTETGFYYLQSRYYDPQTCRFINADSYTSTGQGILGYNMFSYCMNDPVNSSDPSGHAKKRFFVAIKMLWQALNGNGKKQYYGKKSSVSKSLRKSTAMKSEFDTHCLDFIQSGKETKQYSGSISTYDVNNKYDYDLSLSVGAASYTMEIKKETRTHGILFWKKEQIRYTATVTVTDIYDFDAWRRDGSFGSVMNNIGLIAQDFDVIKPYEWEATFTMSTEWG